VTASARPARRRWENRAGWWGILRWCCAATAVGVLACGAVAAVLHGGPAGLSALTGGGAVLVLSALTGATTAVAWDRARAAALPLSVGAFLVKLVLYALLLATLRMPEWMSGTAVAVGALVGVVVWQAVEVLVFARTRRGIYAD